MGAKDITAFLRFYEREGQQFLDRIVTTDETIICLYEPESKLQLMVWKTPASPPPVKAKTCKSATLYMFVFFMDSKGMLLQYVVPQGRTVNGENHIKR